MAGVQRGSESTGSIVKRCGARRRRAGPRRILAIALCPLAAGLIAGCAKNTSLPGITGNDVDGSTLTAAPGTWTGKGSIGFTYVWERCDSAGNACQGIAGATANQYGLSPTEVGSTLRVVVTGTDADGAKGASSATSPPTGVVQPQGPANTTSPAVTGTAQAGQTLSATQGVWRGTPPLHYTYQWQRCTGGSCADVSGSTNTTYSLGTADVGSSLRVGVTATNNGGKLTAYSTQTGVVAAAHDPVVVAVGDIACAPGDTSNDCVQATTARLAAAQHPDAVLDLGDNQYNSGLLSEYMGSGAYNATWGVFNSIVFPAPGNHEYAASPTAAGYFGYFGSRAGPATGDYSFNLGTWHLISLNSSCTDSGCSDTNAGVTTTAQTAWLQNDLAGHPTGCTLAYWHHPRFSASWSNDSPGVGPLFAALYNAHADLVLSGHDHVYERYAQQDPTGAATSAGVREIVAGTGGESLFSIISAAPNLQVSDQNDFGVLVLTLHAASYDWAFKRLDGTVVDSGTTSCHGSGGGSASLRAARDARRWPPGPSGPRLRLAVRPESVSATTAARRGLPVDVHMTRAADVTIQAMLVSGRRRIQIATFRETETQLPGPHSRIVLRLPRRRLTGKRAVALLLRFTARDGAGQRRVVVAKVTVRSG